MIFDNINNWHYYFKQEIFKEIFEKLGQIKLDTTNGVHFKTEHYYFKVMSYDTQINPTVIENHRKEVDVQILLSGTEKVKLYSKNQVKSIRDYDKEDDCEFYKPIQKHHSEITLQPGYMGVFFNQDIHAPLFVGNKELETIKKIVIKINEEFFTS